MAREKSRADGHLDESVADAVREKIGFKSPP
jgi:hypothetical protein